jgi:sister-chromatid-cohesion protein PDS5
MRASRDADILHRYIDFYLDLIASSDNVSLLYHLAMKAKTVRDGQSHTYSEVRIGIVCRV